MIKTHKQAWMEQLAAQLYNSEFVDSNATAEELLSTVTYANSRSIRVFTIVLSVLNILAGAAIAATIIWTVYKRQNRHGMSRTFSPQWMREPEVFPLALAIAIVIQGLVFAGAQSSGLYSVMSSHCDVTAQFVLPGMSALGLGVGAIASNTHSNLPTHFCHSCLCRAAGYVPPDEATTHWKRKMDGEVSRRSYIPPPLRHLDTDAGS
jgi:hypothetical protein